jgi:hypothetical protein
VHGDSGGDIDGSDRKGGGDDGDGISCDGGVRSRLVSSSPSFSSLTSHLLFLVLLAGGEMGSSSSTEGSGSAEGLTEVEGWSLSVDAMVVDGRQVVMVADEHRWRRRRCLRMFAVVVGVGK